MVLRKMIPGRERLLLGTYWMSPIVIVASYLLGLNDLIPVLFLILSLYCVRQYKLLLAGVLCVAAISAKLSMVIALPFFLIYLLHNKSLHQFWHQFVIGLVIGCICFVLPFVFSASGLFMLLSNPEMGKVYSLSIDLGGNTQVYLVPLAYLLLLYASWRVKRLNFELFYALLGISFLLVVLLTPASPGWFIWAIPLLVTYQAGSDRVATAMTALFSVLYVLSTFLFVPHPEAFFGALFLPFSLHIDTKVISLVHTLMVAVGTVFIIRIWRETISRNDFFRLNRKPFVIGVTGDSGAGKDTFSMAIKELFGHHSVTTLSGDDYHLWDRQKPLWQVMTHLNPLANDLDGFTSDLATLTDGKSIQSRHYDHQTGRMSRPFTVKSNDIIIVSGLHALYLPLLRECYNLSVYLDIDEGLRRYFKIQRDVHQRGYTAEKVLLSFEQREPDSARFIRSQASYADLVLSLQPIHPRMLDDAEEKTLLRFKLVARSRHGLNEHSLMRALVGVCGLHVDMVTSTDASEVEFTIEGETSALDIAMAAQITCPRILEFLDIHPKWQDGATGLMQLVTLSHINQALTKRLL